MKYRAKKHGNHTIKMRGKSSDKYCVRPTNLQY